MNSKEIKLRAKEIDKKIRDLEKQINAASFKKLSKYSQKLIKEEYAIAHEEQMNLIAEII